MSATHGNAGTGGHHELIAATKVNGTAVYNRQGEKLGSVYDFMVNKQSGQVAYAVMSFGGFLGLGERYHPLPWGALTYDVGQGGYVVDEPRERLTDAPHYGRDETPWTDPGYGRRISEYYNIPWIGV